MMPSPLAAFLRWHQHRLQTHPYALNSAQSALLMAIGDGVAQSLEMSRQPDSAFDPARLAILTSWAAGVNAPFWTWWYRALNLHWQGGKVAGWVLASASLSPIWNGAFFTYTTTAMHTVKQQEGNLALKVSDKLSTHLVPTVVKSCCLWIPFNYLNFRFVPLDYRMLCGGLVALGWNVFLSFQASRAPRPDAAPTAAALGSAAVDGGRDALR